MILDKDICTAQVCMYRDEALSQWRGMPDELCLSEAFVKT